MLFNVVSMVVSWDFPLGQYFRDGIFPYGMIPLKDMIVAENSMVRPLGC